MKVLLIEPNNNTQKCGICHSEILNPSNLCQSELLHIPVCNTCENKFSKEDIELALTILTNYGGYFGLYSSENYSLLEDIKQIIKKKISIDDQEGLNYINIGLLHNALLYGFTPEEYISKLERLIS